MPETTIDLPWPPSQNAIWRGNGKHVYRNPKYVAWLEEVGWLIKASKPFNIKGYFSAYIVLCPPDKRLSDIDNRVKVLLDAAQKYGIVENDHLCRELHVRYGSKEFAPLGARVVLTSISSVCTS